MKKILLLLLQLACLQFALANPVNERTAQKVAERFLSSIMGKTPKLTLAPLPDSLSGSMFLFVAEPKGYVIVSADDYTIPILAYSTESEVSFPLPEPVAEWLYNYAQEIDYLRALYEKESNGIRVDWENSLAYSSATSNSTTTDGVAPLIQTKWGQSPYYNAQCPSNPSGQAITGCVATATAQIMRYWNHPQTGVGSHSYTHPQYGTLSANFGATTYDWPNMPVSLTASSTPAGIASVAQLMYHVGVAVEMNYGTTGSSSSNSMAAVALKTYFQYDPNLRFEYKSGYPDSIWKARLRYELNAGHPVLYRGSQSTAGHSFVCDGYSPNDYFHFNWGWKGSYDGDFHVGNLNPGVYTFNSSQAAVFGIIPVILNNGTVNITAQSNNVAMGEASIAGFPQGTFAVGDTVELLATSYPGSRFFRWSDGVMDNPRQYIVSGNHNAFTAHFESTAGDTMRFHNGVSKGTNFFSSNQLWGIRLLPSELSGRDTLKAVKFHNGSYITLNGTLRIYSGEWPADSTLIHQQAHSATPQNWNTVVLDSALGIPSDKKLWILFDIMCVSKSTYCGNSNGSVFKQNGTWKYNKNYSWMVETIFSHSECWNVTGNTIPSDAGYISGVGRKPVSSSQNIQLIAYANDGYRFSHWTDGDNQNPRIISALSDTSFSAVYDSINGDTIFCDGGVYSFGHTGTWVATAFSPQSIGHNNRVNSIHLFSYMANHHNHIRVFQGNSSAPETMLLDTTVISHVNNGWECVSLQSPIVLDTSQWLWLAWDGNQSEVPISVFSGNNYSRMCLSEDSLWRPLNQYGSLMIRGVLGYDSTPLYALRVNSSNSLYGSVSGSGAYYGGSSAAIQAYPSECYQFVAWSDGNSDNPRQITISSDSTIVAVFAKIQYSGTEYVEACDNFTWHGIAYTSVPTVAPTYVYNTAIGCDSIVTLNLTLNHTIHLDDTIVACDSVIWHGLIYRHSNAYATYRMQSTNGCDTISHLQLTIKQSKSSIGSEQACDSLYWNGMVFYTDTVVSYTTVAENGCDSVAKITIRIQNNTHTSDTVNVCGNYYWHGTRYDESPTGPLVYSRSVGNCTQSDTLHLTIYRPTSSTDSIVACDSTVWHNVTYRYSTTLPTYYVPEGNSYGCDSIVHLNLTIKRSSYPHYSIARGCDSVLVFGNSYYADTTVSHIFYEGNAAGCDSTETVHLYVHHTTHDASFMVTCDEYYWHGQFITQTPAEPLVYSHNDWYGCVSTDTLFLTINQASTSVEHIEACDIFTWHGITYTSVPAVAPTYVYNTALGCDSIVTLNLTLNHTIHLDDTIVACDSVIWHDSIYRYSNIYATYRMQSTSGCDTISHLRLTIKQSKSSNSYEQACDSLYWNGMIFYTDTVASYTTVAENGCDSVAKIIIQIQHNTHTSDTVNVCGSYYWHGTMYDESPTGPLVYSRSVGNCTQSDTLHLTIHHPTSSTDTIVACDSAVWHNVKYTYSTTLPTYYVPEGNSYGCDSVVYLNLTIKRSSSPHYSIERGCDSVLVFGNSYYVDTTVSHIFYEGNAAGCDSTETVHLYVHHTTHDASFMATCDEYYWHGLFITQSPAEPLVYSHSDWYGCVSTDTLFLTINHASISVDYIEACDSIIWHGTKYTYSTDIPTYEMPGGNQYGCDSTVELNLTIHHSSHPSYRTMRVCDSVSLWDQTFTQDTIILHVLPNANVYGCDSSERISLYVTHTTHTATVVDTCNWYSWHYQMYTQTPDTLPVYTHTDYNGCTSSDTLYLTIHYDVTTTDTITLTDADFPYDYNGEIIQGEGNYNIVLTTYAGCDSTIQLHVEVHQEGFNDIGEFERCYIYPNPTKGIVYIRDAIVKRIEVYNDLGQLMAEVKNSQTIDLSTFPQGVYALRIVTSYGQVIKKVVKNGN